MGAGKLISSPPADGDGLCRRWLRIPPPTPRWSPMRTTFASTIWTTGTPPVAVESAVLRELRLWLCSERREDGTAVLTVLYLLVDDSSLRFSQFSSIYIQRGVGGEMSLLSAREVDRVRRGSRAGVLDNSERGGHDDPSTSCGGPTACAFCYSLRRPDYRVTRGTEVCVMWTVSASSVSPAGLVVRSRISGTSL